MAGACIRRYTYLPYRIDLLQEQRLTFVDPSTWDDKNDAYYMALHKKRRHLESVRALSFTDCGEKCAVWKVFGGSISGVAIQFHQSILCGYLDKEPGVVYGEVLNKTKDFMKNKDEEFADKLPFIKRWGFREIWEFRAIYENNVNTDPVHYVHIGLESIDHITFNPWIPEAAYITNSLIIHSIRDCQGLHIVHSDLVNSPRWQSYGDGIANLPQETLKPTP